MATTGTTCDNHYEYEKPKKEVRKYLKKDYNFTDKIYISTSNSDNFQGLIIPSKFEKIIKTIVNYDKNYDIIDSVYDNYEEYRDYEVEYSHQARHGSNGSEKLNTLDEILEYFMEYDIDKLNKKLIKFKGGDF